MSFCSSVPSISMRERYLAHSRAACLRMVCRLQPGISAAMLLRAPSTDLDETETLTFRVSPGLRSKSRIYLGAFSRGSRFASSVAFVKGLSNSMT